MKALHDILRRMQDHQMKKRPMLRRLSLADRFSGEEQAAEAGAPPSGANGGGSIDPAPGSGAPAAEGSGDRHGGPLPSNP